MSYQVKLASTAYPLAFMMIDSTDHLTGKTGLTVTVTIRKVGGSFASPAGAVTEIANGWYEVAGNATDSGTLGPLLLHATATGADPTDTSYEIVAYDPQSATDLGLSKLTSLTFSVAGQIDANVLDWKSATAPAMTGDAFARLGAPAGASVSVDVAAVKTDTAAIKTKTDFLPSATAGSAGGVFIAGTNAATAITTGLTAHIIGTVDTLTTYTGNTPQTGDAYGRIGALGAGLTAVDDATLTALAAIQADTDDIQTRLPAALVSGRIDASVGAIAANAITAAAINADAITAAKIAADVTTELQAGLATPTNITAGTITTVTNLTNAPTVGDLTAAMKTSVENAVLDADVATHHTTAGSAGAKINAAGGAADPWATALPGAYGAGSAGKIIGDNINAKIGDVKAKTDNLPSDPADESLIIAATDAIAAAISALNNLASGSAMTLTAGACNAVADALLVRVMTESYAPDGAAPTVAELLFLILQNLQEFSIAGTTITVKKLDGAATAATYTLDSATAPTSRSRTT